MLTRDDITNVCSAHNTHFDSYEDFTLRNQFHATYNNKNEHKYNARFDDYFFTIDRLYNKQNISDYIVSQQMIGFKKLHTATDFNDIENIYSNLYRYSVRDIIRTLNRITHSSINDDLLVNFKGWEAVAKLEGVDLSSHYHKFQALIAAIKADDVITPILSQIEKIEISLKEVHYDLNIVHLRNPTDLEKSTYIESCFNLKRHLSFFEKFYNQENLLNTLIKQSNIFEHINEYKKIRQDIVDTLMKNNADFTYSYAHKFVNFMKNASNVELMLLDRADTDLNAVNRIRNDIKIDDKTSSISQINIFDDNSVAVRKNTGEWVDLHSKELKDTLIEKLVQKELFNRLKKSPTIAKMFLSKLKEDFNDCERAFIAADTYLEYEAILKSKNYNLLEEVDDLLFEELDDSMNAYVRKHKIEQFGLSISSKKYQHLYDEESFKNLELLYDLKIPTSELQDSLGKKLASFKNSEDFNKALKQLYSIHSGFNNEAIIKKANIVEAEIIKNEDNMIIIKIENFHQSAAVGSSSWCIVRDEVHFKSYKEDCHQYFVYDLNKEPTENNSLVGITLHKNGSHSAAHFKNDNQLCDNDEFKTLQLEIVKHDIKSYPELKEDLKAKISINTETKKQSLLKNITSKLFNR